MRTPHRKPRRTIVRVPAQDARWGCDKHLGPDADLAALRAALSLALAEMRSQGSADAIGTARAIPITREEANRIGAA
jgi:hypothetical protein